jgi:hypothetical protein
LHNWETRRIKDDFVREELENIGRLNKQKEQKKQQREEEAERLRVS